MIEISSFVRVNCKEYNKQNSSVGKYEFKLVGFELSDQHFYTFKSVIFNLRQFVQCQQRRQGPDSNCVRKRVFYSTLTNASFEHDSFYSVPLVTNRWF